MQQGERSSEASSFVSVHAPKSIVHLLYQICVVFVMFEPKDDMAQGKALKLLRN